MSASTETDHGHYPWWKSACVYQIYPSSFKDSNNDGTGDLPGIISKLDYVKSLGVDAVWLSPFFESPDVDKGYDISDYQKPAPQYGTLEDVDAIIKGCHERGIKVLFDLVINHTSDQHKWFLESKKSKDNPYRKYYHWRPPRYDDKGKRIPPTNWRAVFGGSVWQYDETTDEYYLHFFTKEQPDLNWEDPEVRQAIYKEAVLFWLERGLDGFRVDASTMYSKRPFEDWQITAPEVYDQPPRGRLDHGPNLAKYLQELTEQTFAKYDALTIAECAGDLSLERMLENVARKQGKFTMAIGFDILGLDHDPDHVFYPRKWTLEEVRQKLVLAQELCEPQHDAWTPNYLENHDHGRSVSRFGDESPASAKMLALYLSTLSGTLMMYQGQELGTTNLPSSWPIEDYPDPASQNYWRDVQIACKAGDKYNIEDALRGLQKTARDHSRTPFQWSAEKNAGFCDTAKPWMGVNPNYTDINAEAQEADDNSVLNFWRRCLKFRKQHADVLINGTFHLAKTLVEDHVLAYTKRSLDCKEEITVYLNWTGEKQEYRSSRNAEQLLISTVENTEEGYLQPWEGKAYARRTS